MTYVIWCMIEILREIYETRNGTWKILRIKILLSLGSVAPVLRVSRLANSINSPPNPRLPATIPDS